MLEDCPRTNSVDSGCARLARRRRIFSVFFLTVICTLCLLVGFESRIDVYDGVSHSQRALKNMALEEDALIYGDNDLNKEVQSILDRFGEEASNVMLKELLLRYLQENPQFGSGCLKEEDDKSSGVIPIIYIITPTYRRVEQVAELTRLGQTLRQLKNVHWLVVEDAKTLTPAVRKTVSKMGIPYTLLTAPMPDKYATARSKPRGVSNRNAALDWIRKHAARNGVFYFADDDNSYDLELFEEIRYTKKISMFPVGMLTAYGLSSPVVQNGTVTGFYDGWIARRKFPVDMAGFAVSVEYFVQFPDATMPYVPGYEEDGFLLGLNISKGDIEPLAGNCTKILVWHTQTKKMQPAVKKGALQHNGTNIPLLVEQIF